MRLEELQAAGEAAPWLTQEGLQTLQGGYLLPDETPKGMYRRLADHAEQLLGVKGFSDKVFQLFWKGWLCPATPVASNFGANRALPISCYSLAIDDSVSGIFNSLHEMAMLSKNGGGVAYDFSRIRHRGAGIAGNIGKSEGVIPWLKIFDVTTVSVSQGAVRRGATAAYAPVDHGDIHEFLNIRRPTGDQNRQCLNIHHGVTITDEFMHKVESGDKEARALWIEILKTRQETGEPYLMFIDNVNRQNPDCYKSNGLRVSASNICCLRGDELVVTAGGYYKAKELVGKQTTVWDGNSWVSTEFKQFGVAREFVRIELWNRTYLDVTPEHRVPTDGGIVQARNLLPGSMLVQHKIPGGNSPVTKFSKVRSVTRHFVDAEEPVYCCTVPTTSLFALANGLMTGNCEITLHSDLEHTFVCCLSSMNLSRYDEWKDTDAVETAIWFLDAVMEDFINRAKDMPGFERAVRFAVKSRALGLGALGWHTYLQEHSIPFESFEAFKLNSQIFKQIQQQANKATRDLAAKYGEPEWCKGFGVRNTHTIALAPTVSNAIISGNVSPSIEPLPANAFTKKTAKGAFIQQNPTLRKILAAKGKDTDEVWKSIAIEDGSVQHLDFLSEHEREVFKTGREINQMAVVNQAAARQKYIDQAQSVNLLFPPDVDPKYFHKVHMEAWRQGLKTLYYCRTGAVLKGDVATRFYDDSCKACEG